MSSTYVDGERDHVECEDKARNVLHSGRRLTFCNIGFTLDSYSISKHFPLRAVIGLLFA